tara:strand:- start:1498 stop:1911 length:414 start_codon:yes stop_codon:yes gene_type:complete
MKKSDFKELIKESIKEVLIEEGVLKNVISEVVKAVGQVQEIPKPVIENTFSQEAKKEASEKHRQKLTESKRKMLEAIGKSSYGGVDIFEGTSPLSSGGNPGSSGAPQSPLAGTDPADEGIDISDLLGNSNAWKQLLK